MRIFLIFIALPIGLYAESPIAERPAPGAGDIYEYDYPDAPYICRRWQIIDLDQDGLLVSECGPLRI